MYGPDYPIILINGRWLHEQRAMFAVPGGWYVAPAELLGMLGTRPPVIGVHLWLRDGTTVDVPYADVYTRYRPDRRPQYDFLPRPDITPQTHGYSLWWLHDGDYRTCSLQWKARWPAYRVVMQT